MAKTKAGCSRPTGGISGLILLFVCLAAIGAWIWGSWWISTRPPAFTAWVERMAPPPLIVRTEPAAPPRAIPVERRETVTDEHGQEVLKPAWTRQPTLDFPEAALRANIQQGVVVLECEAMVEGGLGACEAVEEAPSGYGFAEAALEGARDGRVAPRTVAGVNTDTTIRFRVVFRMSAESPPSPGR